MIALNGVLRLSDFSEPAFSDRMRSIFASSTKAIPGWPLGYEMAKAWEITQAIRAFDKYAVLRDDAEVLGVAAGWEHTVYYLTNFVRRVFATDLYATNEDWSEADREMLRDPARFAAAGNAWNPRRLVVQHMNALDLRYEENSFDGIFSSGSIEHFGTLENVAQAMREMARVLKPGGVVALSTEFRIDGPDGLGIPGSILFTEAMLREYVIDASGLELVETFAPSIDPKVSARAYPLAEAVGSGTRQCSISLTHDGYTWTSVALCLRKGAD